MTFSQRSPKPGAQAPGVHHPGAQAPGVHHPGAPRPASLTRAEFSDAALTRAERTLAQAAKSRTAKLDSAFPVLFIEATPGADAEELLLRWADETSTTDMRTIIRADKTFAGSGDLSQALLTWLRRTILEDLPPVETAPTEQLATLIPRLRQLLVVAITKADWLDPAAFLDLINLVARRDAVRLVVAGFDCSRLMAVARDHGLPYSRLDDADLAMGREEIAALLAVEGFAATPADTARIHRHSSGLPAIVRDALARSEVGDSAAILRHPGELGAYIFTSGLQHWPSPLVALISTMVHIPRFTMLQAAGIARTESARVLVSRMMTLGLGQISFDPVLRQQTFNWFDESRTVALDYLARRETPHEAADRRRRTIAAAQESFDAALMIVTQVADGQLGSAERYLASWLWDCLPNGYSALWDPLLRCDPSAFADHPRLLLLRLRVEPRDRIAPVLQQAIRAAVAKQQGTSSINPWQTVGALALEVEFARLARNAQEMTEPALRALELAQDLTHDAHPATVTPGMVSDLLLLADATFRLGNHAVAAEFANCATNLIDAGPQRADPWRDRRACAGRIRLVSLRERGLPDPLGAAEFLAGPQFRWREADMVAQALSECWAAIDQGNLPAAEDALTGVMGQLQQSLEWPALWYQHMWVLGLGQQRVRAQLAMGRYHACLELVGRPQDCADHTPQSRRDVAHVVGEYVPMPKFLPPADETLDTFPRWQFEALLLRALESLRGERTAYTQQLLTEAVTVALPRTLSPTVLTVALPEEIRSLRELISGHPFAHVLQLEHALAIAGQVALTVALSGREREVLSLLRKGLTNAQMAQELFITVNTVKFHRANLMRKLDASTRQKLLETAGRLGL